MKQVTLDKFSGCLLGQCLGDALGCPVEGFSRDECLDYLQVQVKPLWYGETFSQRYQFGQYTDDSQMARELLASLTTQPEFSPDDYIRRLRPLFENHLAIVPGIACVEAMLRLANGATWQEAGCPPPQAGNGTAMRAAPVGMLYQHDPAEMIRIARQQGWITHRDPRCDAGSVAVAGAVALALKGKCDPPEFCSQLAEWMDESHHEFAELVRQLPQHLALEPEEAVYWIARAGKPQSYVDSWPGVSPFVIGTVLWSIYSFLKTPDNYLASIWTSIGVGGDVDTTAAITGAISGAYNGKSALPLHLLVKLHDHGEWRLTELERLCDEAYNRGQRT